MKTKKTPIKIQFNGIELMISPDNADQWFFVPDSDYRLDIPVSGYDVHYCEDYNQICVYRVNEGSVDFGNTIFKKHIK